MPGHAETGLIWARREGGEERNGRRDACPIRSESNDKDPGKSTERAGRPTRKLMEDQFVVTMPQPTPPLFIRRSHPQPFRHSHTHMSHRIKQIASNLQQAIQQVLARGLHDPRIGGLVTITNVVVAADLKTATVFVSVFPEEKEKKTMFALRDAARHIRREVGEIVAMHQVPQLTFKPDSGLKREIEAYQAIAKIAREREEAQDVAGRPGADAGADHDAPDTTSGGSGT